MKDINPLKLSNSMKRITQPSIRFALTFAMLITLSGICLSQSVMPEILNKGTLPEQMNYIEGRTRIYENYRAIREDMFQKLKDNSIDSLSNAKKVINSLETTASHLNNTIDSLNTVLDATKISLKDVTATKNNIRVMGMDLNKLAYNAITWTIIAGLIFLLAVGFLAFKRNMIVTSQTKKDLEELKIEFEDYRQQVREAREKMSMAHFNEIKKLKGN